MISPDCPVFQLDQHQDKEVNETADITFYTQDRSVCLLACFDFALCELVEYDHRDDKCQLFTPRGKTARQLTFKYNSDVYFKTCQGVFIEKKNTTQKHTHENKTHNMIGLIICTYMRLCVKYEL